MAESFKTTRIPTVFETASTGYRTADQTVTTNANGGNIFGNLNDVSSKDIELILNAYSSQNDILYNPTRKEYQGALFAISKILQQNQEGSFSKLNSSVSYWKGAIISYNSNAYISNIDLNNNAIGTNLWSSSTTYALNDLVLDSNGNTYKSLVGSNTALLTDTSSWSLIWIKINYTYQTPLIKRHLIGSGANGAVLSYNSTSLLNFESIEALDSTNTVQIITNSTVIKNISSNFVSGTGNGGKFFSGVLTNVFYPCFVISDSQGVVVDFGIDNNTSCSNIPSGYTKYRLIGYIYINSSLQIKKFFQNGCIGYFETTYDGGFLDRSDTSLSAARTLKTLSVPPNTTAKLACQVRHGGAGGSYYYYIRQTNATDFVPSNNDNDGKIGTPGGSQQDNADHLFIQTDSSSQVALRSTDASLYLGIITLGYIQQF